MSIKDSNIRIFLVTGPGHHAEMLKRAISESGDQIELQYATYWPRFGIYKFSKTGEDVFMHKGKICNFLNWLLWGMAAKFPKVFKKSNWHLVLSYRLFDWFVCSHLKTDILWAWGQMSAITMQKAVKIGAKVVLEYPMIHCDEWEKILVQANGRDAYEQSNAYFSDSMLKRIRKEYQLANHINVLSTYAASTFKENGIFSNKLIVSELYVDVEFFKPSKNNLFPSQSSRKLKLLFVGRLELLKGIKLLVTTLLTFEFDFEIHFVGQRYQETDAILDKLGEKAVFYGVLAKDQLLRVYQNVDLLVLPSLQESFGMVLLEALSCGLPILASKNTGGVDLVQNGLNGFIFDPFSVDELKEGLHFFHEQIVVQGKDFTENCRASALAFSSKNTYQQQINKIIFES